MSNFKIAVVGLPGSGKTTLCQMLMTLLPENTVHVNADTVRSGANDWDFSDTGRMRQAHRMRDAANEAPGIVLIDTVCPTPGTRKALGADMTIFMNTVKSSRYPDTDAIFVAPKNPDITIHGFVEDVESLTGIVDIIVMVRPQGVMIGRFQPFHEGHKALFKEVLKRHGFVNIMLRQLPRNAKNPMTTRDAIQGIYDVLNPEFLGQYIVTPSCNVAGVYYGRDVGYAVEEIKLPSELESISATEIRKERGIVHEE